MISFSSNRKNSPDDEDNRMLSLFVTERAEDYIVLSLALTILIAILAFY